MQWLLHHKAWPRLLSTQKTLSRQYQYKHYAMCQNEFKIEHFDQNVCFLHSTLVNMYKAQKSPAAQHVGVKAFYLIISYVCEDTLRHPPTRQYLSSCVEILGQVHTCKCIFWSSLHRQPGFRQ